MSDLLETTVRFLGHRPARRGRQAGVLQLGRHPVADQLRALGISPEPLMVASYLDGRLISPFGNPIGAARDYTGYLGRDRPRARFTVEYPGTGPIDQYSVPPGVYRPQQRPLRRPADSVTAAGGCCGETCPLTRGAGID